MTESTESSKTKTKKTIKEKIAGRLLRAGHVISHERRAGDRRRHPRSRRKGDRAVVRSLVGIVLFLFVVNVMLGVYVIDTLPKVQRNSRLIETSDREAAFRICARDTAGRAEFRVLLHQFGLPLSILKPVLAGVEQRQPIVDCEPNFHGQRAVIMAPEQQRAYVSLYAMSGRVPETIYGRVTGRLLPRALFPLPNPPRP